MRKRLLVGALLSATLLVVLVASTAFAKRGHDGGNHFKAHLNGFNEVVGGAEVAGFPSSTGSVSTLARGTFEARLRKNPLRLEWTLDYSGIEGGTVTQAHPHFAQRHVGGDIFGFLCGGPKPVCPQSGTVSGTWTAADVIGPTRQGVEAEAFDEFVRALRAGAVYVNVHSSPRFPEGEIRGQVGRGDRD